MRKVRPEDGSSMLVMILGCSPHVKQRGEVGCRAGFLMPPQNAGKSLRASYKLVIRTGGFGGAVRSRPLEGLAAFLTRN
jgi:hypothetical protein